MASTYPVASASSSVTYAYNPKLEAFDRRTLVVQDRLNLWKILAPEAHQLERDPAGRY